jgi:hypothetical protein
MTCRGDSSILPERRVFLLDEISVSTIVCCNRRPQRLDSRVPRRIHLFAPIPHLYHLYASLAKSCYPYHRSRYPDSRTWNNLIRQDFYQIVAHLSPDSVDDFRQNRARKASARYAGAIDRAQSPRARLRRNCSGLSPSTSPIFVHIGRRSHAAPHSPPCGKNTRTRTRALTFLLLFRSFRTHHFPG